jgi:PAS domain S-box-containing protein
VETRPRTADPPGEIKRLQRCINDLVSVLALPAIWTGGEPSQIVGTLLDAVLGMLRLDLIYVRVNDPAGDPPIEMVRVAQSRRLAGRPHAIGLILHQSLGDDPQDWPSPVRTRVGNDDMSLVTLRLGVQGDIGILVAGCDRAEFPDRDEALVLSVAANQAAIGLREAWLRREQMRVATELDRRVAQRTADLAAANHELKRSEAELRVIIETIPGLVWCATPEGRLDYLSRRILDFTGTTLDAFTRGGWTPVLHPGDVEPVSRAWSQAVATGEALEIQCRLRGSAGSYGWVHLLGQAARDSVGRVVRWYGLLIDTDDRKTIEEALRSSEARLSRATHTAIAGEFAASLAHEINQPLAGIITNASTGLRMLAADPPNIDGALETARRTIRDGNRASEVITRLRALFRKQGPMLESVDLNEAVGEVIVLLQSELERSRVVMRTELAGDLPFVTGDRVQLQQVILNLLRNASDAMSGIDDRPRLLAIRTEPDGDGCVRLSVRDAGAGFGPDKAGRLFDAFYTTKSDGMGIGLSVSRSIIDSHHGRLWATANEDGSGATFTFSVPCNPGTP